MKGEHTITGPLTGINVLGGGWSQVGDDSRHLIGPSLLIDGVPHHIEAFAVETGDGGLQEFLSCADALEQLHAALGGDGPWQTVSIGGRAYVLIITPHCD